MTSRAVEKPGWKISWNRSPSAILASGAMRPCFLGLGADAGAVEAGAVIGDRDRDLGAGMDGGES